MAAGPHFTRGRCADDLALLVEPVPVGFLVGAVSECELSLEGRGLARLNRYFLGNGLQTRSRTTLERIALHRELQDAASRIAAHVEAQAVGGQLESRIGRDACGIRFADVHGALPGVSVPSHQVGLAGNGQAVAALLPFHRSTTDGATLRPVVFDIGQLAKAVAPAIAAPIAGARGREAVVDGCRSMSRLSIGAADGRRHCVKRLTRVLCQGRERSSYDTCRKKYSRED